VGGPAVIEAGRREQVRAERVAPDHSDGPRVRAAARMLEHGITKERLSFVYGWHRLIVAAPTRDLCLRRVEAVTEHYRDIGIDIVNSTDDQFSLLTESLPRQHVRANNFQRDIAVLAAPGGAVKYAVPTPTWVQFSAES